MCNFATWFLLFYNFFSFIYNPFFCEFNFDSLTAICDDDYHLFLYSRILDNSLFNLSGFLSSYNKWYLQYKCRDQFNLQFLGKFWSSRS